MRISCSIGLQSNVVGYLKSKGSGWSTIAGYQMEIDTIVVK